MKFDFQPIDSGAMTAETFFRKIPALAIAEDEPSLDRFANELLNLLMSDVDADIGQISLLPVGGRVEKVCIVKDGRPWLKEGMTLHLFNPSQGFAGHVITTGQTLRVEDIWDDFLKDKPNPFLEIFSCMDPHYVEEIKRPVASTLFLPVKRGNEILCVIELGRYRSKPPFTEIDQKPVDAFVLQYGALIINHILDTKNRIALNTVCSKLNLMSRFIASKAKVDYSDAVSVYQTLSAADLGFAFFRRGSGHESHALRIVAWQADAFMDIDFPEFIPSNDSILCDQSEIFYPIEGDNTCRRLQRFRKRIDSNSVVKKKEKQFLLEVIDKTQSYAAYPLHMLDQDLGAIHLASSRKDFCKFLQLSPFLSLCNSLLKSFLLNERVAEHLSEISLKIHDPGFSCLAALKSGLIKANPKLLNDPAIYGALNGLEELLENLHEKGKILKSRNRDIHFKRWLQAYVNQKTSQHTNIDIQLDVKGRMADNPSVRANYEQLETIFDNLFANSLRAIGEAHTHGAIQIGSVHITLSQGKNKLIILFEDNGHPYKTVGGRGTPQIKSIMKGLGGSFRRYREPIRIYLTFPLNTHQRQGGVA